ncbi:hypothetical protein FQN57_000177 [Myotisia sp. PD_48]|nr:hypothetical protein FQN57_000177 [Myotisia sp. PD_48]
MKLQALAIALGAIFIGITSARQALQNKLDILETADRAFVHLADDGVMRSFSNDFQSVIGYIKLTNAEIMSVLNEFPEWYKKANGAHLNEVFRGIDGTKVTDEKQLLHPPVSLLPQAIRDARKNGGITGVEEMIPKGLRERKEDKLLACAGRLCHTNVTCPRPCKHCVFLDMARIGFKMCI